MDRLGTRYRTERELDWLLLRDHTVAPIGHLRIATEKHESRPLIGFDRAEVLKRDARFLEYAAERGAAIGGATGAGGDAPKILLAEDNEGQVYPAGTLPDSETKSCLFVKWPRGRDTHADRVVLHTEHIYASVLNEMGLDTRPGDFLDREGEKPSLWLSRFDRVVHDDHLERLPVESLYSLAGITRAGASVSHQKFLQALRDALERRGQLEDLPDLVREYLRRELLDLILGNSDNHGRNRALIRGGRLSWTPIYDLAPMVLDPAGITRSTRWDEYEDGGRIDWPAVLGWLDAWLPELAARDAMHEFATSLLDLPERLRAAGANELIFEHPAIRVGRLGSTFEGWGLL